ncbi:MAG: hypothetical protein GWN61_18635 [candidate division Zixibacteria bacterium]|nr:hypothetical protein [candidate division Zixibacteria bacterium]NIS47868.1 hypothetical protein [candidate division Zixibacteria bacterium]NIU15986.1 hypothetical protein [candidate division Zixibacteria bacterium]NIV08135.1 hypothetical protein [candidate division Zixibacteria bacterium]NIW47410.1 hypothetical protein [Gammaproteobacteria bacterium]
MKKTFMIATIIGVSVLALSLAGFAYAQSQTPADPIYPWGHGTMHGFGGFGMMGWNQGEEGPMHEAMVNELAELLGLTEDEIEARHDAGETMWEIAQAEGLSDEEIQEFMFSAHDFALEDAVANGWMTQEQAEWMESHMDQMWQGGNHCEGGRYNGTTNPRSGMNW